MKKRLTIASGNVSIDLGATKVISKVITAVTTIPLAPGVTTIALYSYQHFSETNTYLYSITISPTFVYFMVSPQYLHYCTGLHTAKPCL